MNRRQSPEHIARRARAVSQTRLGWCPPHMRAEYFRLMKSKHLPAAECKRVIMEHLAQASAA